MEPWLVAHGYAESARLHAVEMRLATEAVGATLAAPGVWEVRARASAECQSGRSKPDVSASVQPPAAAADDAAPRAPTGFGARARGDRCAGLYGPVVESWRPGGGAADGEWRMAHCDSQVGADAAFHITPRKGQFVVLAPPAGATPPHAVLELVPTQFTKGVIVWTTVWGTVVVGPTAEPQTSRDDRRTDEPTVRALIAHGEKCVPALKGRPCWGRTLGCAPRRSTATIRLARRRRAAPPAGSPVAGIRSTGLTVAPGIGEYVAEMYVSEPRRAARPRVGARRGAGPPPPGGCAVGVTHAACNPEAAPQAGAAVRNAPVRRRSRRSPPTTARAATGACDSTAARGG